MKKVFLLALALCAQVAQTKATDMAMNCTQQGFQIGVNLGMALTTTTNTNFNFPSPSESAAELKNEINDLVVSDNVDESGVYNIYGLALDYSNISTFQSNSYLTFGLNTGYKWMMNCNQYSVTTNVFVNFNGSSMNSNLYAAASEFQVVNDFIVDEETSVSTLIGSVGGLSLQYAGKLKLTNTVNFGFSVLLAKEFNWGNAGLLLGMKFNAFKLKYLITNPVEVDENVLTEAGFVEINDDDNADVSLNIGEYLGSQSKTQVATGFTIGFSTNYYIADNLSAGLTVYYDMYTPVTFNLNDIPVSPFVYADNEEERTTTGKIKFQNNTIGVMMNLTYSFGAN